MAQSQPRTRRSRSPRPAKPLPQFLKDAAPPVLKDDSDPSFVTASGRELYHWLGFESKETTVSSTAAVVNSLPLQPWQPAFVLVQVAACVYIIATSGPALGLPIALACAVSTYFLFDLFSGFVHYCLDWEGFNHIPFFGALCQTFQHHHKDTTFIWRSNIWSSVSEVGLFLHISDTLPLALFTYHKVHVPHIFWYCSACKTLWSMVGELGHRAAHKPPTVRSRFERFMQRIGIYLDPKFHLNGHHNPKWGFQEQFCELGWMDPIFDAMRLVIANHYFWGLFTLAFSYFDTWVLGVVAMVLAGRGHDEWGVAGYW